MISPTAVEVLGGTSDAASSLVLNVIVSACAAPAARQTEQGDHRCSGSWPLLSLFASDRAGRPARTRDKPRACCAGAFCYCSAEPGVPAMANIVVEDVSLEDVKRGLADGSITLIDVREPNEWAAGHIAGATLNPLSTFDCRPAAERAGQADRVPVPLRQAHAAGAGDARRAADGPTCKAHFGGSMLAWEAAGEPVVRVSRLPARASLTASPAEPLRRQGPRGPSRLPLLQPHPEAPPVRAPQHIDRELFCRSGRRRAGARCRRRR